MLYSKVTPAEKRVAFRKALADPKVAQFPGAFTPLSTKLIQEQGFEGVYISGGVLANELGLPDIGLTTLTEVATRAGQIARSTDLPALVAAVPAALQAVEQALASETPAAVTRAARQAALTPVQRTQAQAAALALEKALARSELAQGPLDVLGQLLSGKTMAPLVEALERFDFDQALAQLQQLRTHWLDMPSESVA